MKKVKFFFIFFICLNSINLFSQEEYESTEESNEYFYEEQSPAVSQSQVETQPQAQAQPQTVEQTQAQYAAVSQNITPLTWELVNLIQNSGKSLNELAFYISKSFSMVISEQYDPPKIEIQNGTLIMPDRGQAKTIVFNGNQPGRLHGFPVSGSTDIFEVIFQTGSGEIALKFKKNRQNYFELFSAVIDTRPYTLHSDMELLLAISSNIAGGDQVQAFPSSGGRSEFVEGKGSLQKSGIIAYIKKQNPSVNDNFVNKLIDTYIEEAAFENINHDIAIAQMLYATSFLKGSKFVSSNNYGGLLELPSWDGKFATMTEGVRAHIQHIKGYASVTMNNKQIVDPRYYLLINLKYLGTVKTLDQLCQRWVSRSASADYKKSIEKILNALY